MTLSLQLTPDQEKRLQHYARLHGKDTAAALADILEALPAPREIPLPPRTSGLHRGNILYISPDFDEPLPDAFWLNEADNATDEDTL
jgi:hypothetical protein